MTTPHCAETEPWSQRVTNISYAPAPCAGSSFPIGAYECPLAGASRTPRAQRMRTRLAPQSHPIAPNPTHYDIPPPTSQTYVRLANELS